MWEVAYAAEGDAGVTRLEKELAVLTWYTKSDARWDIETTSPFFPLTWKREQVMRRIKDLGLSALLGEQVMLLVEAGEVRRLNQVRVDFEELMRAHRREVDVTFISATPLSADHLRLMHKSIQADYLQPEDNLIFVAQVDPSLQGGYKVVIKGQEHDMSWAKSIDQEKQAVRSRRLQAHDVTLSRSPRPLTLNLRQALTDLKADKEMKTDKDQGDVLGDLFPRSLAMVAAREKTLDAVRKQAASDIKAGL
jgi:F0F1-type ATP synthase delta subunit